MCVLTENVIIFVVVHHLWYNTTGMTWNRMCKKGRGYRWFVLLVSMCLWLHLGST
jgi:hypothetical protein